MKKAISLILTIAIFFTLALPAMAATGNGWSIDAKGHVIIENDAGMADWAKNGQNAHYEDIRSLEVKDGVTYVAKSAFNSCFVEEGVGLTTVSLPDSIITIEDEAFGYSQEIKTINIPKNVKYIGQGAFACSARFGTVTIPASVTEIGNYAFGNDSITEVTFLGAKPKIDKGAFDENRVSLTFNVPANERSWDGFTYDFVTSVDYVKDTYHAKIVRVDTPAQWAAADVSAAIDAGLVPAQLQSKYQTATTRAEFCALAVALYETATGKEITARASFADTTDINVQKIAGLGIVAGTGGNNFRPDAKLTREQAAKILAMLSESLGKPLAEQAPTFADNAKISAWATGFVGRMQASGVMKGVSNNNFAPKSDYTREQSIATMLRLFNMVK